jgi:hypothetical protein
MFAVQADFLSRKGWVEHPNQSEERSLVMEIIHNLLSLPVAQELTSADVMALLQSSLSHGLVQVTHSLLRFAEPVGSSSGSSSHDPHVDVSGEASQINPNSPRKQQAARDDLLDRSQLHALLMCCVALDQKQLRGGMQVKVELCECLLTRAAQYGFDGSTFHKLLSDLNQGFPWEEFRGQAGHVPMPTTSHPAVQLLKLGSTVILDTEVVCSVIEACISGGAHSNTLVQAAVKLQAAAQLSRTQIRQLTDACVQHQNFVVMQTMLHGIGKT